MGALGVVESGTDAVVVGASVEVDVVVDVELDVDVDVDVDVEGTAVDVVVASADSGDESGVASPARSAEAQLVRNAPATSVTTIQIWRRRGTGIGSCVMRRSSAARLSRAPVTWVPSTAGSIRDTVRPESRRTSGLLGCGFSTMGIRGVTRARSRP